ncbi:hypothetical protein OG874_10715 [Nocardia sp. NBC_00565]|uniref:hypothetical protein n=1 Tax=Nocardia sp. NBC_00565 TaxID=2975993 RepID=UPI002E7FDF4C|nr:hypothetical protein [Nocardia sp. NBC_00565]WUC05577.1 hypothetical protein OG874_10715 [Nocardia sp. NBC_00565]
MSCFSQLDVSDPESLRAFLLRVTSELGAVDALVDNAGIMPIGSLLDEDDELTPALELLVDDAGTVPRAANLAVRHRSAPRRSL